MDITTLHEEALKLNKLYNEANKILPRTNFQNWCERNNRLDLLKEWDFERNLLTLGLTTKNTIKNYNHPVYWICNIHNESYLCRIDARSRGANLCKQCSKIRRLANKAAKTTTFKSWCEENGAYGQQLLSEWDTQRNQQELNLTPSTIHPKLHHKVYWKCTHNPSHQWEQSVLARTRDKAGSCPHCQNEERAIKMRQTILSTRSLLIWCQEHTPIGTRLISEWHTQKNQELLNLTMSDITPANNKMKVYWKCSEGHEFQQTPWYRTYEQRGCPHCNTPPGIRQFLDELYPELIEEWHYEKNPNSPHEYSIWSTERVWWRCSHCNHEWQSSIFTRTQNHGYCPHCRSIDKSNQKLLQSE